MTSWTSANSLSKDRVAKAMNQQAPLTQALWHPWLRATRHLTRPYGFLADGVYRVTGCAKRLRGRDRDTRLIAVPYLKIRSASRSSRTPLPARAAHGPVGAGPNIILASPRMVLPHRIEVERSGRR